MEEPSSRFKTIASIVIALLIIPAYSLLRNHVLTEKPPAPHTTMLHQLDHPPA